MMHTGQLTSVAYMHNKPSPTVTKSVQFIDLENEQEYCSQIRLHRIPLNILADNQSAVLLCVLFISVGFYQRITYRQG